TLSRRQTCDRCGQHGCSAPHSRCTARCCRLTATGLGTGLAFSARSCGRDQLDPPMSNLKPSVRIAIKAIFSAIAIGGLIAGIDWNDLPQQVVGYQWEFALAAFIGLMIQFPVSGLKWHAALRVCNVDLSPTRLTRFYCISHFVGQFLPTSIGGDAY